jgi:hypothetical protein
MEAGGIKRYLFCIDKMNEKNKAAYRHLMYCAFLEIRQGRGNYSKFNPIHWYYSFIELEHRKTIAEAFHNLAIFNIHDFEGFDEDRFWNDIKTASTKCHEKYYRIHQSYLNGKPQIV